MNFHWKFQVMYCWNAMSCRDRL